MDSSQSRMAITRGSVGWSILVHISEQEPLERAATYYVVKLEVPMHDRVAIGRQMFPHIVDYLVEVLVGSAKRLASLHILDLGLIRLNARERIAVSSIETCLLSVAFKSYRIGFDTV